MTRSVIAALLFASVACLCLNAQTIDLKANIPFEFRMGAAVMSPGEYTIHYSAHVLTVRTTSGKPKGAMVLAQTTSHVANKASELVFNRYSNDHYFLAKLRDSRSGTEQSLWPSAAEKELIAANGSVQIARLRLQPK